mmetsp:Transcript_9250/g.11370  ORF Transcript_9250/g.11370 Transcript_9250/m.11370 type:complete len:248 (+) Transcript_9250:73-816(+)|eukprot:CAMPEP_0197349622 /NCGR_PEP_ID=MMETSP0893-20130614/10711_1 /TAXON_ID=44058 ORGANISM="Aureoumbra lagunensis, Strain CCMP1510" /NCGR_SAMPLE_ID=MMETSP0893 /ASSEMBLY_ACC=CAM_ASM_000539 /LENGTH=247 /DNA_ID=CAMNT_0042861069 /DNA_START=63 /DNA_END=806 /DNA_ORIENTATION=-
MKTVILALALFGSAVAFVHQAPAASSSIVMNGAKDEMVALAEANPDLLGSKIGFWDPLKVLDLSFWNLSNEATIGYLRHSEIKHGRVAMAAFLGYLAQSTPQVSGPHKFLPYKGYEPGLSPPEQWDAMPLAAKIQIFTLIGMLESYGEILDPHYCNGGLPGYYPPIKGKRPEIVFNLYDPFEIIPAASEAEKVRGRQCEINNGRLAMFGILGFLAEAKVPGSVPLLTGLIPGYDGNCMDPFEGQLNF